MLINVLYVEGGAIFKDLRTTESMLAGSNASINICFERRAIYSYIIDTPVRYSLFAMLSIYSINTIYLSDLHLYIQACPEYTHKLEKCCLFFEKC